MVMPTRRTAAFWSRFENELTRGYGALCSKEGSGEAQLHAEAIFRT